MKTIKEVLLDFYRPEEADRIIAAEFGAAAGGISPAWYVNALAGAGGWFAAFTFLFACYELFRSDMEGIIGIFVGVILCAASWTIDYFIGKKPFFRQFALALGITGLASPLVFSNVSGFATGCAVVMVMSALMVAAHGYAPTRFIAVQIAVIALVLLLDRLDLQPGYPAVLLVIAALVLALWTCEPSLAAGPRAALARVCTWGLTASLIVLPVISGNVIVHYSPVIWVPATAGMGILLVILLAQIFAHNGIRVISPPFAASAALTAALVAITSTAPGIITALFATLLGFFRGSRVLTALAGACLGGYLIVFYYDLSLTLIVKSYILMGSGVLFIAAWISLRLLSGGERQ